MGHDTYAYDDSNEEISYLRRGASNRANIVIYEILDCLEHYAGVSGCGTETEIELDKLVTAIQKLDNYEDSDDEYLFLAECIKYTNKGRKVKIKFY